VAIPVLTIAVDMMDNVSTDDTKRDNDTLSGNTSTFPKNTKIPTGITMMSKSCS
jgi:hypothetical protein